MKNYYLISSGICFGLSVATYNSNKFLKSIVTEEKNNEEIINKAIAKNNENASILIVTSALIVVFAIYGLKK